MYAQYSWCPVLVVGTQLSEKFNNIQPWFSSTPNMKSWIPNLRVSTPNMVSWTLVFEVGTPNFSGRVTNLLHCGAPLFGRNGFGTPFYKILVSLIGLTFFFFFFLQKMALGRTPIFKILVDLLLFRTCHMKLINHAFVHFWSIYRQILNSFNQKNTPKWPICFGELLRDYTCSVLSTYRVDTVAVALYPAGTWRSYNVMSVSMQCHDVASTLMRHCFKGACSLGIHIESL